MTTPSPARPLSAVDYTKALANNGLSHPFSPPPLLHIANSPLFPRSCNTHSQVSSLVTGSLRTQLFQKRVMARLSHPSRADEQTLQRFAGKYQPQPKGPHLHLDDNAVSGRVCARSEGLRRWVDRPCFEDRLAVYRPAEQGEECEPDMEGIVCVPVSGTILGVAALEFSEHLENLAGLYDDFAEDMTVTADAETDAATEVTFMLTTSPTLELPKAQEIPASIEFPRRLSQDLHAAPRTERGRRRGWAGRADRLRAKADHGQLAAAAHTASLADVVQRDIQPDVEWTADAHWDPAHRRSGRQCQRCEGGRERRRGFENAGLIAPAAIR
ncbi:hypothetical protein EVJ58_g8318 [Rhodofomes roseus]|uniref:Uncharacterized protein n=1 Tax=Rhodofomes roseus TaxID=34475 RepID=A0A4Y9XZU4_9APHY|nr:hypothetical protein EVJ58_g8318 [Rhodofomes roseus]